MLQWDGLVKLRYAIIHFHNLTVNAMLQYSTTGTIKLPMQNPLMADSVYSRFVFWARALANQDPTCIYDGTGLLDAGCQVNGAAFYRLAIYGNFLIKW